MKVLRCECEGNPDYPDDVNMPSSQSDETTSSITSIQS